MILIGSEEIGDEGEVQTAELEGGLQHLQTRPCPVAHVRPEDEDRLRPSVLPPRDPADPAGETLLLDLDLIQARGH